MITLLEAAIADALRRMPSVYWASFVHPEDSAKRPVDEELAKLSGPEPFDRGAMRCCFRMKLHDAHRSPDGRAHALHPLVEQLDLARGEVARAVDVGAAEHVLLRKFFLESRMNMSPG